MKKAIEELMSEHELILKMLSVLRGMCLRLEGGQGVEAGDLEQAVGFIKDFADYNHHAKEEDHLFAAMEKAGFPRHGGPVGVMLMEHEQGRAFVAALSSAAVRLKNGEAGAVQAVTAAATGYVQLLSAHIFKENQILYPMAMDALPDPVWSELAEAFVKVEAQRMGPAKRAGYEQLVARLEAAYPAPPASMPHMACGGGG